MNKRIISINIFTALMLIATSCWGAGSSPQSANDPSRTILAELPDTVASSIIDFVCRQLVEKEIEKGFTPETAFHLAFENAVLFNKYWAIDWFLDHGADVNDEGLNYYYGGYGDVNSRYSNLGGGHKRKYATPLQAARDLGFWKMADLLENRGGIATFYDNY